MRREASETAALRAAAQAAKAVPDAFERAVAREDVVRESAFARPDDRQGLRGINPTLLSGVTSSTSLRPDDRSGSRGIGATSTVETASSSSGTDWNPAFYAGAGLLGAMLVAGGAVALTRRQHGGDRDALTSRPPGGDGAGAAPAAPASARLRTEDRLRLTAASGGRDRPDQTVHAELGRSPGHSCGPDEKKSLPSSPKAIAHRPLSSTGLPPRVRTAPS